MGVIELMTKRNDVARLFRHQSKIHRNCIRINIGSSLEHELKKFQVCWNLKKQGKEFITEAEFERPGIFKKRADIVCLDDGVILEIIVSEREESLLAKEMDYPLPIIKIYARGEKRG